MRILLINDYATPTGGAELGMLALRDGLRRRGHDARLFASSARPGPGDVLADYQCFGTTGSFRTLLQTANPWAASRLRRALAEFRPDVVHVTMFLTQLSPLILPLLKGLPSLYHVVWYRPICPLGTKMLPDGTPCTVAAGLACRRNQCLPLRDWLPLMLQMRLVRRWRSAFDRVVVVSEALGRRVTAEGLSPVEVLPYGVPVRPARPPLSWPPTAAFAGRLVREKGVDVLLRAFARVARHIPEARLLVAGAGSERQHLSGLIAHPDLSSRVVMMGHLARTEVENHFNSAWVQVVPSRWEEPLPLAGLEALMRGTALIASRTGGLTEMVHEGQTGLLVTPGDVDALAEALLALLRDRDLAERMGAAGRRLALEVFSDTIYVERFLDLYRRLLRAREKGASPDETRHGS